MGKRELFIALAFVVAGVVAYRLTAPPPPPGVEGFSFSRFWSNARRGMRANAAQATFTRTGSVPVSHDLTEVRLEGTLAQVRLIGEARADIAYELNVQSNGPDHDAALAYAKQVTMKTDDLGASLTLRVTYPRDGRQSAAMILHVPSRLGVLVASASGVQASNLGSAHLDSVSGDVTVAEIAGALTGLHRNGSLTVRDAGSVKLTLQRSRASFDNVQRGLTLDIRDGECRIANSTGPVEIDEVRAEITVANHSGPVRIGGNDGRVTLTDPHDASKVDVRRAEVEASLMRAVPLTLLTTDDTLRLMLDGPPHVAVDAAASLGRVHAEDFQLSAESGDQESRLTHSFGGSGGARVSLRNLRGDIVIRNAAPGPKTAKPPKR
jgi:hypothetical protein